MSSMKQLLESIQSIEEGRSAEDFKAEQNYAVAKELMQSVKSKNDLGMVNGNFIEAETGILKHKMISNQEATYIKPHEVNQPAIKQFIDKLTAVGVPPKPYKLEAGKFQISGQWQDVFKIDIEQLKKAASAPQYAPEAPVAAPVAVNPVTAPVAVNPVTAPVTADPEASVANTPDANVAKQILKVKELLGIVTKEGIVFKSRIGTALLESFDLALNEAPVDDAIRPELDSLWKSLLKGVADKKIIGPQAQEITTLTPQVDKWFKDHPAPAVVSNTPPAVVSNTPPAVIPDKKAVIDAGNHPQGDTDPRKYAAVNSSTGALYKNDTIGPGSKDTGDDHRVQSLQKLLGLPETGVYGPAEKKAVEEIQKKAGITQDGKYGPETRNAHGTQKNDPKFVSPNPADKTEKTGVADKQTATTTATPADTTKQLTVQPVVDGKAGKGPSGEPVCKLGDGTFAYYDKKNKTYVPWDINQKKTIGAPIKLTDFKIKQAATADTYTTPSATADDIKAAKDWVNADEAGKAKIEKTTGKPGAQLQDIAKYHGVKSMAEIKTIISKELPTPKQGDKYWVDGIRYEYNRRGWEQSDPTWSADRTTRRNTATKYTGINEDNTESGYDEVQRLVSLVHFR